MAGQVLQASLLTPQFAPGFYCLTYPRSKYGDNEEENPTLIVSIRKRNTKRTFLCGIKVLGLRGGKACMGRSHTHLREAKTYCIFYDPNKQCVCVGGDIAGI